MFFVSVKAKNTRVIYVMCVVMLCSYLLVGDVFVSRYVIPPVTLTFALVWLGIILAALDPVFANSGTPFIS